MLQWELSPDAVLGVRWALIAVGALLCLRGAVLYRVVLMATLFGVGAGVGFFTTVGFGAVSGLLLPWFATPLVVLVFGAVCMGVGRLVHRMGLAVMGLVAGGAAGQVIALQFAPTLTLMAVFLGAAVGMLVFPWLYQKLLTVLTSVMGASLLTLGLELPNPALWFTGFLLVGVWFQAPGKSKKQEDS